MSIGRYRVWECRRLRSIDLTTGGGTAHCLPQTGRYFIVFQMARSTYFQELRKRLEAEGTAPAWRGHSDTEVLLAAIDAWGLVPALQAAVGMFALALWDRQERDAQPIDRPLGEKPLYTLERQ